ncbi:DNA damage-regulated autophagy modulator protein 1-like isoform X1 [Engystomops pustulosus]|uniref:DNA damage-regulated autophagy modulator protein 1-like isoform X1 n=1 Tax=Engystomops pustulosus TaxID=76066 RepID=UPI003AFB7BB5
MEIRGLGFFPLLWITWTLLGLGTLVALTVISGHEKYPYISDTGKELPESAVYTTVFMVASILGAGLTYIQYRFMIIQSQPSEKRYIICQRILLAMGWIACIGTAVSAAYSLKTNPTAHRIGAGVAFLCNAFFNVCQAVRLYKRSFGSRRMCHLRLAFASVTCLILVIFAFTQTFFYFHLCSDQCLKIVYAFGISSEYLGFSALTLHQLTNWTDFQRLSLKLSREGVSICLREKIQDPENPA